MGKKASRPKIACSCVQTRLSTSFTKNRLSWLGMQVQSRCFNNTAAGIECYCLSHPTATETIGAQFGITCVAFGKNVSQCFDISWFDIASRLDMKPWQAASLQEFASAVSYASSRVRDLLNHCGTLMTFLLWKHEVIYTVLLPWYGHNSGFGLISGSS